MTDTVIRLEGLDKADARELGEFVPADELRIQEAEAPEGSFGELALATALIVVSAMALKGFVAWLAYRNRGKTEVYELEYRKPDGTWVKCRVRIDERSDDPVDVQAAQQLSEVTGLPWETILQGG